MANPSTQAERKKSNKMAAFAVDFINAWDKYAKTRLTVIEEYERSYYGAVKPTLKGRSNIPWPVMGRYIDELKGRMDAFPAFHVENHRLAQTAVVKKVKSAIDILKKPTRGDWARRDRMGRNFSVFAGYNAIDFYTERDGKRFNAVVNPIDHNEFVFEPMRGADLAEHSAVGKFPIFRRKSQIEQMVKDGVYDSDQAKLVINRLSPGGQSTAFNDTYFKSRYDRYKSMGLDAEHNNYLGEEVAALGMLQINWQGKRYLLVFEYKTGVWLRCEPMKEVYGFDHRPSIDLWQTHEDPNVVMCKSPLDDIYPVSEAYRMKANQLLDNHTKRIWGQRAVDPNFFPDANELEWKRPDQIVEARSYNGKPISTGIYEFRTEDSTDSTLKFLEFMDNFLASVIGIDPSAVAEESQKVGVMFGQLMKSSARLGVYNKSYAEMWERGLQTILYGMNENMDESMMVRLSGTRGVEWDDLRKEELGDPDDFEITAESSTIETEMNEAKKKRQTETLSKIIETPSLLKEFNLRSVGEELIKAAEFDETTRHRLMDVKNYGEEDMLARADAAIEMILKGKEPPINPDADISFYDYLMHYSRNWEPKQENKKEWAKKVRLLQFAHLHKNIVMQNMRERAREEQSLSPQTPPSAGSTPALGAPGQGTAIPGGRGRVPAPAGRRILPAMPPIAPPAPPPAV